MHFYTFILKNLLRRPARSLLTIVGLAVAICAVVALVGVATGFERSFLQVYSQRGIDLIVQRAGGSDNLNNTLPEQLLERIAALPDVHQAMGGAVDLVSFQKYGIIGRLINGWPADSPLFDRVTLKSGRQLATGDAHKAMIGRVLAINLNKKVWRRSRSVRRTVQNRRHLRKPYRFRKRRRAGVAGRIAAAAASAQRSGRLYREGEANRSTMPAWKNCVKKSKPCSRAWR